MKLIFDLNDARDAANYAAMSARNTALWIDAVNNLLDYSLSTDVHNDPLYWMRHSLAINILHTPSKDSGINEQSETSCGITALAAVTGASVCRVHRAFPSYNRRQRVNREDMRSALKLLGYNFRLMADGKWPRMGLGLIHFVGPWTASNYPARILQNSHWVGVLGDYIFDINWPGWLPRQNWNDIVLESLLKSRPQSSGWSLISSYELLSLMNTEFL